MMEKIKHLAAESLRREEIATKREKVAGEKMKIMQFQLLSVKVQVDDLKSKKEVTEAVRDEANDSLRRLQDRLASRDKELEDLKKREAALSIEVEALREEIDSDQALTHLTARAALMRQHVKGLNPMA